jgi:hypothetical protein
VAVIRDLETVRLGEQSQFGIATFVDDLVVFLVPDVTNSLEEEQREDVGLEIGSIYRAAQDVGGLPEVGLQPIQYDGLFPQDLFAIVMLRARLSHHNGAAGAPTTIPIFAPPFFRHSIDAEAHASLNGPFARCGQMLSEYLAHK